MADNQLIYSGVTDEYTPPDIMLLMENVNSRDVQYVSWYYLRLPHVLTAMHQRHGSRDGSTGRSAHHVGPD